MLLSEIASACAGELTGQSLPVTSYTTDSRQVKSGALFVAIAGENVDGHNYIAQAAAAGAAGALVCRDVENPTGLPLVRVTDTVLALGQVAKAHLAIVRQSAQASNQKLQVIGITGSVGKTSTKDLVAQILQQAGPTIAPPGSFNNEVGMPLTVLRVTADTRYLVLEMGASEPGNLHYLTDIAPVDVAVVLGVGCAHLAGFGSVEVLAKTKAEILQGLLPGGSAILNLADPAVANMASTLKPGTTLVGFWPEYSKGKHAREVTKPENLSMQVTAGKIAVGKDGKASFMLELQGAEYPVGLGLVGAHHITNALAAAAVCMQVGCPTEQIIAGLATGPASAHRMNVQERDAVTYIDDAYNANPDSMRAGIDAACQIAGERRVVAVLGDMLELGSQSVAMHAEVGGYASESGVQVLIAVGEKADAYLLGAGNCSQAIGVPDLSAARKVLATVIQPEDVVLFKGSSGSKIWQLADEYLGGNPC